MTRQTSIAAYNTIKENGSLSKMRFITYDLLFKYGPQTANQLMEKAVIENRFRKHQTIESIGRRLPELRDSGVAREPGTTKCPITGHKVILWDVTDRLPLKSNKTNKTKSVRITRDILIKACENARRPIVNFGMFNDKELPTSFEDRLLEELGL